MRETARRGTEFGNYLLLKRPLLPSCQFSEFHEALVGVEVPVPAAAAAAAGAAVVAIKFGLKKPPRSSRARRKPGVAATISATICGAGQRRCPLGSEA